MVLLDTGVFIAVERGTLTANAVRDEIRDEVAAISAITFSELMAGVHAANNEVRRGLRESFINRATEGMAILPVDEAVARIHARLCYHFKKQPIGAHDLLIASTALAHNATVVTLDLRSFPRIPELKVITLSATAKSSQSNS